MQILDEGHLYHLNHLDGDGTELLRFVKREGLGYPGNDGHYAGTNLQEVLRALIDRFKYLDSQEHCDENYDCIYFLRHCILSLEQRAAKRHKRLLVINKLDGIEFEKVCYYCGHIQCTGQCDIK